MVCKARVPTSSADRRDWSPPENQNPVKPSSICTTAALLASPGRMSTTCAKAPRRLKSLATSKASSSDLELAMGKTAMRAFSAPASATNRCCTLTGVSPPPTISKWPCGRTKSRNTAASLAALAEPACADGVCVANGAAGGVGRVVAPGKAGDATGEAGTATQGAPTVAGCAWAECIPHRQGSKTTAHA